MSNAKGFNIDMSAASGLSAVSEPQAASELGEVHREETDVRQYSFRARKVILLPASLIDRDDSGDFDPAAPEEDLEKRRRRDEGRQPRSANGGERSTEEQPERIFKSRYLALQHGGQLIFTVPLTNEALKEAAAATGTNWPESPSNFLEEEYFGGTGYREFGLRSRPKGAGPEVYEPLSDPRGVEESLLGHPDARGCVSCRLIGCRCTLLDCSEWPCLTCYEDGDACILITPPIRKASCEHCKTEKAKCSLRDEQKQSEICERCIEDRTLCMSGPAPGYERARISYDQDAVARAPRAFIACTSCREQGIKKGRKPQCSLKTVFDPPPCDRCAHAGTVCTFEAASRSKISRSAKGQGRASAPLTRPSSSNSANSGETVDQCDLDQMETDPPPTESLNPGEVIIPLANDIDGSSNLLSSGLPMKLVRLVTALCHPITFNCDTAEIQFSDPFRLCDWCSRPGFGPFGLGFKKCMLREAEQGLCYEEKVGHQDSGCLPCRMCTVCTMDMLRIIYCQHEQLGALPNEVIDANAQNFHDQNHQQTKFCTICPSPAVAECRVLHAHDAFGVPLEPHAPEARGCGLKLCYTCHDVLSNTDHTVQTMLKELRDNPYKYGQGVRADAELLRDDGLLVKNLGLL